MASPNACGVAACVLSALKQANIHVNPVELRRAFENTATPVEQLDPFGQGAGTCFPFPLHCSSNALMRVRRIWLGLPVTGLINAPAAIDYCKEHHGKPGQHIDFAVHVPSRQNARGIYLRDSAELDGPLSFGVLVQPRFEHALSGRSEAELEDLLETDLDLELSATADWVSTPEKMVLLSAKERGGQSFVVRVDPTSLAPGAHFARVTATDATDPARGPLFSLPVTVVVPVPEAPPNQPLKLDLDLLPGMPVRRFITAPEAAEWATVKIKTGAMPQGPHMVIFHAVPSARGDLPHSEIETQEFLSLREHGEHVVHVPVRGSSTMELCMQLSWLANPSPTSVEASVEFHGYGARGKSMVSSKTLRIGPADAFARLEIGTPLTTERINPKAELTAVERAIRPTDFTITAASEERDVLPPSDAELAAFPEAVGTQIHQMVLNYKVEMPGGDKPQSVRFRLQSLHSQVHCNELPLTRTQPDLCLPPLSIPLFYSSTTRLSIR